MTMIIQKVSDVGASNPIVARLFIQTCELIELFSLPQKKKDDIQSILGNDVGFKLIKCEKILNKILYKMEEINDLEFMENFQADLIEVPYIIELEQECEIFLNQARLALTDLSKIFNVFFDVKYCGKEYKGSNFKTYSDWACDFFGVNDDFGKNLKEDLIWIEKIIDMRDAAEHPRNNKKLVIHNIVLISKTSPPYYKEPKWHLTGQKESSIISDMKTILENLLNFSEELLLSLLKRIKTDIPIVFLEIPEDKRDKECPIRIKVDIDNKKLKLPK